MSDLGQKRHLSVPDYTSAYKLYRLHLRRHTKSLQILATSTTGPNKTRVGIDCTTDIYARRLLSTMETRSQARLARQAYAQRPPYPQITTQSAPDSTASSAFQSSSSVNSINIPNSSQQMLGMPQQGFASAPLPSPSSNNQARSYFGSMTANGPTSHPQAQMQVQRIPQSQQQYAGQRGADGGAPETAPFLNDFNLVAEAAKRAQMACLMRDMGDVEL